MMFHFTVRYGLTTLGGHYELGSGVWLGANDVATESRFLWLPAGNPVVFQDWDTDQPNDYLGQDCATYFHGSKRWHDIDCNHTLEMFVCEGWQNATYSTVT